MTTIGTEGRAEPSVTRSASPSFVVRGFAAFDLVVTAVLAVPRSASWLIGVLFGLNHLFGGVGDAPPFVALHWFFVNLAGILGMLWAFARLLQPSRLLGSADAVARAWVSGLIVFHVFWGGAPGILLLFVLTELAGMFAQLAVLWWTQR